MCSLSLFLFLSLSIIGITGRFSNSMFTLRRHSRRTIFETLSTVFWNEIVPVCGKMSMNFDLFGFTRSTEMILCGVGAQSLIKECKRRNISTDTLRKLTKEDFIRLGADADQAENIVNTLCIHKKKQFDVKAKPHHRILDKVEILQLGERQFSMIQDFVKYCRMKLKGERINFFVEPDKALCASQILCMTVDAILKEIDEAEAKLKELEAVIVTPSKSRKHSYMLYSIPFGGLSIATCALLYRLWR